MHRFNGQNSVMFFICLNWLDLELLVRTLSISYTNLIPFKNASPEIQRNVLCPSMLFLKPSILIEYECKPWSLLQTCI